MAREVKDGQVTEKPLSEEEMKAWVGNQSFNMGFFSFGCVGKHDDILYKMAAVGGKHFIFSTDPMYNMDTNGLQSILNIATGNHSLSDKSKTYPKADDIVILYMADKNGKPILPQDHDKAILAAKNLHKSLGEYGFINTAENTVVPLISHIRSFKPDGEPVINPNTKKPLSQPARDIKPEEWQKWQISDATVESPSMMFAKKGCSRAA